MQPSLLLRCAVSIRVLVEPTYRSQFLFPAQGESRLSCQNMNYDIQYLFPRIVQGQFRDKGGVENSLPRSERRSIFMIRTGAV